MGYVLIPVAIIVVLLFILGYVKASPDTAYIISGLRKKPKILILDDSTSALDYATEAKVRQGIRKLTEDAICFIVSQRAASIMDADLLIVLDEGEVAGMGTHEELLKSCEVYAEIYYSQFPEDREEAQNA